MGLARTTFRAFNRALRPAGLALTRIDTIFADRLTGQAQLDRMFQAMAAPCDRWLNAQSLFECRNRFDVTAAIATFYQAYLTSVFRSAAGGSGFNNLLWLYLIARSADPELIIDSGTFTGASAWALQMGAPTARVLSFDIDLSRLHRRVTGVKYIERDWADYDFGPTPTRALAYFDDHVDQARRLIEAHRRGLPLALFDDDFSVFNFAPFAHGGFALPKVEFVTDEALRSETSLPFINAGRQYEWPIDVAYLDQARATIRAVDRLPDTSTVAGYAQLPYRIVALHT